MTAEQNLILASDLVAAAIRDAVAAERKRCEAIAEEDAGEKPADTDEGMCCWQTARIIADRIRKGE